MFSLVAMSDIFHSPLPIDTGGQISWSRYKRKFLQSVKCSPCVSKIRDQNLWSEADCFGLLFRSYFLNKE